ncbi:hypothetical protein [Absidia glauca]|uniref:Uncharacterized protein n=1 Tax=Absidia glauca TaxID=4829 RepID=A0A163J246_ABSGL|nr:hypothetical protein [Absidia glauca]
MLDSKWRLPKYILPSSQECHMDQGQQKSMEKSMAKKERMDSKWGLPRNILFSSQKNARKMEKIKARKNGKEQGQKRWERARPERMKKRKARKDEEEKGQEGLRREEEAKEKKQPNALFL